MRIITGEFKNRMIHKPRTKSLKPTSEMMREALFNILGDEIIGARFADLYAGSGSVGIEALSRGAQRVTFVEKSQQIAKTIRETLKHFQVDRDRARVWVNDVFKLGENPSEWSNWDIAFLDPPRMVKDNFLDVLVAHEILGSERIIIVERPVENCTPIRSEYLHLLDRRSYGKAEFYFFQ